jgi:PAS domain S-box-containing protein
LKKHQDKYRIIFESSPDTIMLLDQHGFIDCNPATLNMFACSTIEEFLGKHPNEYSPLTQPDGRDSRTAADVEIATAYKNGSNLFEWTHQRANGEIFPAEVQLTLLKLKDGDVIQATVRDITERKKIMEENASYIQHLEKLQQVQDVANASPSPDSSLSNAIIEIRNIFESDRAWLLYPCDPAAEYFEVPVESFVAQYPGALSKDQKVPIASEEADLLRKALATPEPVIICPIPKHGVTNEEFDVQSQIMMAIKPRHGKPWLFGLHQCSHEREWTAQESRLFHDIGIRMADVLSAAFLYENTRKLSSAVNGAGEPILITDTSGNIEYVNPAFTRVTGYSEQEVIGKDPSILKSDAQDPDYYKELWETISTGNTWHGTLIDKKKDGTFYPAMMSVAPIYDDNKDITHYVGIQQDITKEKRLEEKLLQSQKMEAIGTLVGGIAHDFNNMLAAIQGNLYLAKTDLSNESRTMTRLENIETLSQRAADIVHQLLTFARKDTVSMKPISLNTFISTAFKLASNAIQESIEHSCKTCEEELIINGDATQLQQVLLNLLNNAAHAVTGVASPRIICNLEHFVASDKFLVLHPELSSTHFARLTVQDNGCGISHEHLKKVFDPFFTTKDVGEGTGLGLAMVYGSIQTHGGAVEVESEPGVGTAFHVYLPLEKVEVVEISEDKDESTPGSKEVILIIDDEIDMREIISEVLSSLNYRVIEACDGNEGLRIFEEMHNDIALVISDIVMPNLGGVDAVKKMRALNHKLPVILMTGYDIKDTLVSENRIEKCIVLSKPFSFEALSRSIRSLLELNQK